MMAIIIQTLPHTGQGLSVCETGEIREVIHYRTRSLSFDVQYIYTVYNYYDVLGLGRIYQHTFGNNINR